MQLMKITLILAASGIVCGQHLGYSSHAYPAPAARVAARPLAYAAAPVQKLTKAVVAAEPYYPPQQYSFGYSVQDALTGDSHSHTESRDGDVVKGQYQLVETDGSLRTVTYTADPINGFNAIVDRSPAKAPVHVVAKAPVAAAVPGPALSHYAAPPHYG